MTKTHQIDYRDNLWLLTVSDRGDQMGFWTLASVLEMVKSGSRITCRRALSHLRFAA
jgi:hypothetical protein